MDDLDRLLGEIKSPEELYCFMKNNIRYGFISKRDGKEYIRSNLNNDELYDNEIKNYYYLQRPDELIKSKVGICYDQVELEREWFTRNGYSCYTFFSDYHNHAFLIYKDDSNYYLFERTIKGINGIYKCSSIYDCLKCYMELQKKLNPSIDVDGIELYNYDTVEFGNGFYEYRKFVKK